MIFSQEKEDFFEEFLTDIGSVLEDICQSGFYTVHDSTLQELTEKGETAARYGMQYLSGLLLSLQKELSANRHRIFKHNTDISFYENHSVNPEEAQIFSDSNHESADTDFQNISSHRESVVSRPAKYYTELIRCIELGKEKTAYDKGKNYYTQI